MWADIEEIGNSAFKGCTGLTEFSVPSDTEVIGHHAFEGCSNLETLIIWGYPDIGEYAFADCVGLTEISIGSDTKNVGDYAFAGCTALSSAIVWGDKTAIGKDAFANCPNLDKAPSARGIVLECTMSDSESVEDDNNIGTNNLTPNNDVEDTSNNIRPEFKETMDSYEAFYTEYCDFMKKYSENLTDLTLLTKYGDILAKAVEMNEAFEAWDKNELNTEELKYYLDVNNRVMQMLIDVAG